VEGCVIDVRAWLIGAKTRVEEVRISTDSFTKWEKSPIAPCGPAYLVLLYTRVREKFL